MSTDRFRRDRGPAGKLQKGPHGRNLCRECGLEVPPRRRTFCSHECVAAWRIQTDPVYVRQQVHARDRGVCRACGLDTDLLGRHLLALYLVDQEDAMNNAFIFGFGQPFTSTDRFGRDLWHPKMRSLWQADHRIGVAENGGLCGLDGYQTLCVPCHKRKTKAAATERAHRRRQASA